MSPANPHHPFVLLDAPSGSAANQNNAPAWDFTGRYLHRTTTSLANLTALWGHLPKSKVAALTEVRYTNLLNEFVLTFCWSRADQRYLLDFHIETIVRELEAALGPLSWFAETQNTDMSENLWLTCLETRPYGFILVIRTPHTHTNQLPSCIRLSPNSVLG